MIESHHSRLSFIHYFWQDTAGYSILALRESRRVVLSAADRSPPRERLKAFCARYHIRKLSYFGSVLRPDFGATSDVDVLVEFEPGRKPGYFGLFDMEEELTRLFGGRKADIRTAEDLSRCFRRQVIAEAKVQYVATR